MRSGEERATAKGGGLRERANKVAFQSDKNFYYGKKEIVKDISQIIWSLVTLPISYSAIISLGSWG